MSNHFIIPSGIHISGAIPSSDWWCLEPATPDYRDIGQKVLTHIDSLDTGRIGEIVHAMRESMKFLKTNISLTSEQWKNWSLVTSSFSELLED